MGPEQSPFPYRVLDRLGQGGMCEVFRATHVGLDRPVALKMLRRELAGDPSERARFLREARTCAGLRHEHVLEIYEVGESEGRPFIAMELVEGGALSGLLSSGLGLAAGLRLLAQVADALEAADRAGIVHRDLKPDNILLTRDGRAKVADWGLSKAAADRSNLTRANIVLGTPAYMSPEQVLGQELTGASDLYALGVILYQLAAGRPPFTGDNPTTVARAQAMEAPTPLFEAAPGAPPALASLVGQLLAKSPSDRPASAGEVAQRLRAIASSSEDGRAGLPSGAGTATETFAAGAVAAAREAADRGRPPASPGAGDTQPLARRPADDGPPPAPGAADTLSTAPLQASVAARAPRAAPAAPAASSRARRRLAAAGVVLGLTAATLTGLALRGGGRTVEGPRVVVREATLAEPDLLELRCDGATRASLPLSFRTLDGAPLPGLPATAELTSGRTVTLRLAPPPARPFVVTVGAHPGSDFALDPTTLPDDAAEALRKLRGRGKVLADLWTALDGIRIAVSKGRLDQAQAEAGMLLALERAGLPPATLERLARWVPTLVRRRAADPVDLLRLLEPLPLLEAALGDRRSPRLPWGVLGRDLSLGFVAGAPGAPPALPASARVLGHVRLEKEVEERATGNTVLRTRRRRWIAPRAWLDHNRIVGTIADLTTEACACEKDETAQPFLEMESSLEATVEVKGPLPGGPGALRLALRVRGYPREQELRVVFNGTRYVALANVSGAAGVDPPGAPGDWLLLAPLELRALRPGLNSVRLEPRPPFETVHGAPMAFADLWLVWEEAR